MKRNLIKKFAAGTPASLIKAGNALDVTKVKVPLKGGKKYVMPPDEEGNFFMFVSSSQKGARRYREGYLHIPVPGSGGHLAVHRIRAHRQETTTVWASPDEGLRPQDRASDDGRCIYCDGWGCYHCDSTGGY